MLLLCFISPIICLVALIMLPLSTDSNDAQIILPEQGPSVENKIDPVADSPKIESGKPKRLSICEMKLVSFDVYQVMEQFQQYSINSWKLIRQPKLLTYCLSHGLFTLAYFIPVNFLSSMMMENHEIGVEKAGFIIPIVGVAT